MRNQLDSWLAGDWVVLGMHVQHWAVALAAIALVALLVAWFERQKPAPRRFPPRSRAAGNDSAHQLRAR